MIPRRSGHQRNDIGAEELANKRQELVDGSPNVGVYVGGLYPLKRIDFLIDAATRIRSKVPDFHLLIIGGGVDAPIAEAAAAEHPWIHYLGPKFGREKSLLVSLGRVFLMPGAVGLAVLNSFAHGIPMVATEAALHGPEIAYLTDNVNGIVVKESNDPAVYARRAAEVLQDATLHAQLTTGGAKSLGDYSIEAMAERFADGVMKALDA